MNVVCISINVLWKGSGTRSHDYLKFMSWCSLILKLRTSVRFCEGLVVENSQLLSKEVRAKESSVVMVTCLAGFSLIGSEEVSCQAEGTWTTVPTCHKRGEILDCRPSKRHQTITESLMPFWYKYHYHHFIIIPTHWHDTLTKELNKKDLVDKYCYI